MNGSAPPLGTIQWSLTIAVSANARMVGSGTGRNERAGETKSRKEGALKGRLDASATLQPDEIRDEPQHV
eukprot:11985-Pelagococcus_subviridis.AAC.1